MADREQVQAWADKAASEHGRVNLIFNNAGVAHAGTVEGSDYSEYEWIMNINFWGVVNGTKAFLPHLKASGNGHVVNVSSVFGLFAQPGMSAYNATKYAVRGFTESLRQELDMEDSGVSASCVHPGGIKTNIAKTARMNESMAKVTGQAPDKAREQFNDQLLRTTPEKAAQVILRGVQRDSRRILIGTDAHAIDVMLRLAPVLYQRLVTASMRLAARFAPRPKSPRAPAKPASEQARRVAARLPGTSYSTASLQGTAVMNPPLPHFRYHPEPLASGSIEASATTCQVLWQGSWLRLHRFALFPPRVAARQPSPWCIADGSAAARYEASFSDDYPLLDAGVAADIVTEVCERTPGYTSWQQERWLVCCEDACAFRGDAGREEIGQLGAEGLAQRFADFAWPAITWQRLVDAYTPGGNPAIYRFDCLHCGQAHYDLDFT